MEVNESNRIRVSLVDNEVNPIVQDGEVLKVGRLDAITPPDSLKGKAFRTDYDIYATARLTASNFKADLASPEWQPLDRARVEWVWNIKPLGSGAQVFDITIEIAFRDKNSGQILARDLSIGNELKGNNNTAEGEVVFHDNYKINIYKYWITKDSFTIGSVLTGLVGAGLTFPFIIERYKEYKRNKQIKKNKRQRKKRK